MATSGLYGNTAASNVALPSGSETSGLYGNNTVFGGTYFEWFVFQTANLQPATPTGGSWDFTTNTGTAPTGWSSAVPASSTATVWVSIGLVNSRSSTAITWSTPGQFSYSSGLPILSGTGTPASGLGLTGQLYIQTDTAPESIWFNQVGTWTKLTGSTLYVDLTSNQTIAGIKTFASQIQGSVSGTSSNVTGIVAVGNGGTGVTTSTGTGSVVLSTSPTLVTPALGTPISGVASNLTGLPLTTGVTGLLPVANGGTGTATPALVAGTNVSITGTWPNQTINSTNSGGTVTSVAATVPAFLSISGSPITTSGTLAITYSGTALPVANGGTGVTTSTGTGSVVLSTSPTLVTPALGTPSSGVVTNLTGTASININGTVGATTRNSGDFTTLSANTVTSTTPVLSFNASNSIASFGTSTANSYNQLVIQNKSASAGASTNYVLSNDLGTDSTYYGEFGMNASIYSSTTPADFFSLNNGVYFSAHDGDVTVGSGNGYKTYFAWGTSGQSAHVINASGALGFSTNLGTTPALSGTSGFGSSGQPMLSGGPSAAPTWGTLGVAGGGTGVTTSTGTGSVVLSTSPTLVTPALGTPSALVGTNITGTAAGLSIGGNAATATTATNVSGGTSSVTSETVSGNLTLSGGTANGVAYLNGSKVVTTGSALVFDGTNLGLGVTPSASSTGKTIEVGFAGNAITGYNSQNIFVFQNCYYNSGYKYASNNPATNYQQSNGSHQWNISPSGTAGNAITFTQAMTLDSSGRLGIGTTSPANILDVRNDTSGTQIRVSTSDNGNIFYAGWATGASYIESAGYNSPALAFRTGGSERMRIDSSGNLGVGTTSPAAKLDVKGGSTISTLAGWNTLSNSMFELANPAVRFGIGYDSSDQVLLQGFDSLNSSRNIGMQVYGGNLGIGTSSPNANTKLDVNGPIRAGGYTVSTLPAGVVGARAYVTDAVTAVFMATPTGGGSVKTPVFYNGTAWVCG